MDSIRTCENSSRSQLLCHSIKHLILIEVRSSADDVNKEATEPAATEHGQILCRSSDLDLNRIFQLPGIRLDFAYTVC